MVQACRDLFFMPGVVIHELAHLLCCRFAGAAVHEVVFYRRGSPPGYVVHTVPRALRWHAAIVVGPLLVNSTLTFLAFHAVRSAGPALLTARMIGGFPTATLDDVRRAVTVLVTIWLGASIGLQALPSRADTASLWATTIAHLRRGNLFAVGGVPIAGVLHLGNALRRFWFDWAYVVLVAWLAVR